MFSRLSLLMVCVPARHKQLIDSYDVLLSNSTMLDAVVGAALLAESMLNKKLRWCKQHRLETSRCPLTHPFPLVPLQRPMHELHRHLLVLSQPGQDELKKPAGKQAYLQKPIFIPVLPSVVLHLSGVIII